MSWEEEEYVLNVPNGFVAGVAGPVPIVPVPNAPARNENKNRLLAEEERVLMEKERNEFERQRVEWKRFLEKERENSKMQLIRYFSGRPNENYQLENWAKGRGFKNNNIEGMREQIRLTREARPFLVEVTKELNEEFAAAAAAAALNRRRNSNIDPNQVGGKRRRKSHRKSRKTARKSHKRRVARKNRRTNRR